MTSENQNTNANGRAGGLALAPCSAIRVGLTEESPEINVRSAVKYWRKAIARGVLKHGVLVPPEPKGRSAVETAHAMKALAHEGALVATTGSDGWTAYSLPNDKAEPRRRPGESNT